MTSPIDALLSRRSTLAKDLQAPGPDAAQLEQILQAAHRVPDHGKIGPWQFIIFEGEARADFGQRLAGIFQAENPDASDKLIDFERKRFLRAPVVIAVISSPDTQHKVPVWEQQLCAGAVCQNLLNATQALGYRGQWLTEWYAYNSQVAIELALKFEQKIAGFVYIGSGDNTLTERVRPALTDRVSRWQAT